MLIAAALLVFGALAISALEGQEAQSLRNLGESLWWSFSTVVTGGFADLYNPATSTGRLVTVGMILLGLTVTGIFTASLTSVLVEDESNRLEQNQQRFEDRLQTVNHKLDLLTGETNRALVTQSARMPPSLLRGGMASGGLEAAAPNVNLPADNAPQLAAGWFTKEGRVGLNRRDGGLSNRQKAGKNSPQSTASNRSCRSVRAS